MFTPLLPPPPGTHGFTLIWLLRTLLFVQMTVDRRSTYVPPFPIRLAGAREMGYRENNDLHTTSNSIED